MVAVFVVASVGSFVDWKKEVQFVLSRAKSDEKNIVSTDPFSPIEALLAPRPDLVTPVARCLYI